MDDNLSFSLSFCSLWEEGGVRRVAERHIPYAAPVQQQDMQRALHRRGRHQGEMRLAHRQILLLLHQRMRPNPGTSAVMVTDE